MKTYYPIEYYSVVLNIYAENQKKQSELLQELPYFNIKLENIKYGKSTSKFTYDKENNSIFKSVSSVKFVNDNTSDNFYELSKTHKFETFVELLAHVIDNSLADFRQMRILIGLGFFDEFGKTSILWEILYVMFAKQPSNSSDEKIKKEESKKTYNPKIIRGSILDERTEKGALKHPHKYSKNLKEKGKKQRLENNMLYEKLVREKHQFIKEQTLYERLLFEEEYQGYMNTVYPELKRDTYVITEMFLKYTPTLKLYNLKDGSNSIIKIDKNKFYKQSSGYQESAKQQLFVGDTIRIEKDSYRPKSIKINDKWEKDENVKLRYAEKVSLVRRGDKKNEINNETDGN